MLRLIFGLIILIASVWLGIQIIQHPGFLMLVYQPWMVQMPIWFALLCTLIVFGLFYLFIVSIDHMQFLWFRIQNWFRFRREQQTFSKTQRGLSALIEERFKKAEHLLIVGMNQAVEPLINYLGAAYAAHKQNAFEKRDAYIEQAYAKIKGADLAIGLTQAEMYLEQGHYEQALLTLNRLQKLAPRHPKILKMLEKIYIHLGDRQALLKLLPSLQKAHVLTANEELNFEKNIYCGLLQDTKINTLPDLQRIWYDMPRALKKNPQVISAYVKALARFPNTSKEQEELIRKALKQDYFPELVLAYSQLNFENLNHELVIIGTWLQSYGPKQELYLALGKICAQLKLWGKAKDYFDKCLALGPCANASLVYGKLLEQLNQNEEALQRYKQGLEQIVY